MKDYKDTLLMMNTAFPMRGNLGVTEIPTQKEWEEKQIYQKALAKNAGKRAFHLHDGRLMPTAKSISVMPSIKSSKILSSAMKR